MTTKQNGACTRRPAIGEQVDLPCPDCGHHLTVHVGSEACPVCMLNAVVSLVTGITPVLLHQVTAGFGAVSSLFKDLGAKSPASGEDPEP